MRANGLAIAGLVAVLGLVAPVPANAQEEARPAESILSGQLELARLVDLAAQRLGINIEYDAAVIRGTVTLRLDGAVGDTELWLLVNRALATRGFTTVRMPGKDAFSIVRLNEAANLSQVRIAPLLADELPPGFVTVIARVQHRPVREVTEALGRIVSKGGGSVVAIGEGGLVMISDLAPRVEQALEVLRLLDVPSRAAVVEEIPLRHLNAQQLATLVTQVSARREQVTGERVPGEVLPSPTGNAVVLVAPASLAPYWRQLVDSLDRRERVETATYSPHHFGLREVAELIEQSIRDAQVADDRWRVVVDDLTSTLIITATPTQHEAIGALIERLDAAPQAARRPVRSFVIKNRSVNEIVRILEQLMQAGVLEADAVAVAPEAHRTDFQRTERSVVAGEMPAAASQSSTTSEEARGPSPTSTPRPRDGGEKPLILTADEGTNTLIAIGEPRLLAQIESLLVTLDVRQPQVMLEVLLLSLSEGQALDLGVELEHLVVRGDVRIRLSSLFGLSTRGSGGDLAAGDGAGFTGVVLSPGDFAIVLRALQTINRGRSLSMPRLLVGNNEVAVLDSVLQQPFATINASATVATTSFGGTQDAGTSVTIKPQIAEGDHLILQYSVALSSFVGSSPAAGLPPPRQQNKVQSVATIPDGYTVVVGGIDLDASSQAISQIPLLGSIPILGEAFKSRAHNQSRSRFYVFIRANILRGRGFEDLKYISDTSVAATDSMIDDGWPTVEPRIIH